MFLSSKLIFLLLLSSLAVADVAVAAAPVMAAVVVLVEIAVAPVAEVVLLVDLFCGGCCCGVVVGLGACDPNPFKLAVEAEGDKEAKEGVCMPLYTWS